MQSGELAFHDWLRRELPSSASPVRVGVGDDMAAMDVVAGQILITCDMLLDGVHFDTAVHTPSMIGRKGLACGLSDCAAMAVRPQWATVALALPQRYPMEHAQELIRAMRTLADEFGTRLVGGDTTSWAGPLAIDVGMVATPFAGIAPVRRDGALAGDRLLVTGHLGGSLLNDTHMRFTPRVREARVLAEHLAERLHAMMDISDGLALDLWRMCEASGVGAALDADLIDAAASANARRAADRDGRTVTDHALGDGEDFELLLAVDETAPSIPDTVSLLEVGRITARGFVVQNRDGTATPLEPRGFQHWQ